MLGITKEDRPGYPCTPVLIGLPALSSGLEKVVRPIQFQEQGALVRDQQRGGRVYLLFLPSAWLESTVTPRGRQKQHWCPFGKWWLVPFGGETPT